MSILNRKEAPPKRIYNGIFKRRASNFDTIMRWKHKVSDTDDKTEEECYSYIYNEFLKKLNDGDLPRKVIRQLKEPILSDIGTDKTFTLEELKGKRLKIFNYYLQEDKLMFNVEFAGGYEEAYEIPFV